MRVVVVKGEREGDKGEDEVRKRERANWKKFFKRVGKKKKATKLEI